MKSVINRITERIIKNDLVWNGLWPFIKASNYFQYHRSAAHQKHTLNRNIADVIRLLGESIVKNGPFKGMKYPAFTSFGSTIFPKIIGSYESELHPLIERLCKKQYSAILDIGSAEGYYAVGFALRFQGTLIYAYDVNEKANMACREMAVLNGVADQVQIGSWCSPSLIKTFNFHGSSLIICDCEGYEKELFNEQNINNLMGCDLLIETHDFIDINISDYLKSLFHESHQITSIFSIDDIVKARSYDFPEFASLDLELRKEILAEKRPAIMEWIYLEPR